MAAEDKDISSPKERKPQDWAIIIGIEDYEDDSIPRPQFAIEDAMSIYEWLIDKEGGGFEKDHTLLLVDSGERRLNPRSPAEKIAPTQQNIERAIKSWLRPRCYPEDSVFFYFAGQATAATDARRSDDPNHEADGYRKYLTPIDADADDPDSTTIAMDEFSDWMDTIQAGQVIYILDTSFSGRRERWGLLDANQSFDYEFVRRLTGLQGRSVLLASVFGAVAQEDAQSSHGWLTQSLLEGLRAGQGHLGELKALAQTTLTTAGIAQHVRLQGDAGLSVMRKPADKTEAVMRPELVLQNGHSDEVSFVVFSPDGRTLATMSEDGTAKLWNVKLGKLLFDLQQIVSLAFSPDGKTLAAIHVENTVANAKLWNVRTGKQLFALQGHSDRFYSVAFSPDGRKLATGSLDGSIKLWDVATGERLLEFQGHLDGGFSRDVATSVAFSPDGRNLATWTEFTSDYSCTLWNMATGKRLLELPGPFVAFSPDGKILATGEAKPKLWDVKTGKLLFDLPQGADQVAFSPDGHTMALAGRAEVILWDMATGEVLFELFEPKDSRGVWSMAFSPDGRTLATVSRFGLDLWNVATGKLQFDDLDIDTNAVAFSPDGQTLATGHEDRSVKLWEAATCKLQSDLKGQLGRISFRFDPNGRALAMMSNSKLWDVVTGKLLADIQGHWTLSPDGRTLVTRHWDETTRLYTVKLWDVAKGKLSVELPSHSDNANIWFVTFSPDGKTLVIPSKDKTAKLWEVATGKLLIDLQGVTKVAFSPDGKVLATSGGAGFKLWEVPTGKLLLIQPAAVIFGSEMMAVSEVISMAFSPDRKRSVLLVTTGSAVELWDVTTGKLLFDLPGVFGLREPTFSPDGKTLVTSGVELKGTTQLWDVATGQLLFDLKGQLDMPFHQSAAFSPDGKTVVTRENKKGDTLVPWDTIKVWDMASGKLLFEIYQEFGVRDLSIAFSPDGKTLATYVDLPSLGTLKSIGPDGKTIATANEFQTVQLWEVATGRLLFNLNVHSDVQSVEFHPDGKILATESKDETVKLWEVETGKLLATLIAIDQQDWIMVTPEGLFDGSETGSKLVTWRVGTQIFDLNQFYKDFSFPGLLGQLMAGKRPQPPRTLQGFAPPPEVKFRFPKMGHIQKDPLLNVSLSVHDTGGGIQGVRLYRNGRLIAGEGMEGRGAVLATPDRQPYAFSVELLPGENHLRATAFSRDNVESRGDEVTVIYNAKSAKPVLHLFCVGINTYNDSGLNLRYAQPDAQAIFDYFNRGSQRIFRGIRPQKPLYNNDATKEKILAQLKSIDATPEDVVLIFFAGHGATVGQMFYFFPYEMHWKASTDEDIRTFGLSAAELGEALREVKAGKVVLVLDACQSGTAAEVLGKLVAYRSGKAEQKAAMLFARTYGTVLIAASTKQQFAIELTDLEHGVLTYTLLAGLGDAKVGPLVNKHADVNNDNVVTVGELIDYVEEQVPNLTEQYQERQYPVRFWIGQNFPLALR